MFFLILIMLYLNSELYPCSRMFVEFRTSIGIFEYVHVIHTHTEEPPGVLHCPDNKTQLLKRAWKKGRYDVGPELWQHGVQLTPTPKWSVTFPCAPTY